MCAGAGKSQRRRTQQAEHFSQDVLHDTADRGSLKRQDRGRSGYENWAGRVQQGSGSGPG